MDNTNLQEQITALNQKVDILLDYVKQQNYRSERIDDLVSDVSLIGKDFYDSSVELLDRHAVEINPEEAKLLFIKFIRNIRNFNSLVDMLESTADLARDAGPIINDVIKDFSRKLGEFEKKGYFEFLAEGTQVIDNIVSHYSREDVKKLAANVVPILDTVKNITQPEMLGAINNMINVFNSVGEKEVKPYSLWQFYREMRKPEMKKALGFMVEVMKKLSASREPSIRNLNNKN